MFKSGYVALIGEPNVGKSTLLNTLLQNKYSIVTSKPQTTRKSFKGIVTTSDYQMVFLDTPGMHESTKAFNQLMLQDVEEAIKDADVVCFVFDATKKLALKLKLPSAKKTIIVLNKTDVSHLKTSLDDLKKQFADYDCLAVSAARDQGMDFLLKQIQTKLPVGQAFYPEDQVCEASVREIAGEMIREKAMQFLGDELPYGLAVVVESFKEGGPKIQIDATLIVEKESQKGMVIGKGGTMIKKIGMAARQDIEKLVEQKARLDLRVKVDHNWTKVPSKVRDYVGFH